MMICCIIEYIEISAGALCNNVNSANLIFARCACCAVVRIFSVCLALVCQQ